MKEKVVLVGAGSAMFTRGLVADILRHGWTGELALVDTDPAALAVAEGVVRKMLEARGNGALSLSASTDRRDVLPGASVVITTIGVGGRRAWEQDVFIPRRHGIFQPVGDTIMPGGSSRALRMIPAMVAIAEDVLDLAPQALFFNYGNPMSPVCRAVHKATGAQVIGLCHGVFHVAGYLAAVLETPVAALRTTALGVNHLTWFTAVRAQGRDLLPRLRALARQKVATLPAESPDFPRDGDNPFTWALTDLFGAFPAVLDRHICEFFPWFFHGEKSYYGKTLGVEAYSFEGTIEDGDRIFAEMSALARSPEPLPEEFFARLSGEHEQVVEIIESIRTDAGRIYSANLPNRGQIPNLPPEAIVEAPAIADASGLHPIQQEPLAAALAGTLVSRLAWVEAVVEAALEGSREKFIQALLIDGAVSGVAQAQRLAEDLLAAQAPYLPQFAAPAPAAPNPGAGGAVYLDMDSMTGLKERP